MYQPCLGAWPDSAGVHFRVWAPTVQSLELLVTRADGVTTIHHPQQSADGYWHTHLPGVRAGDRYRYRVDGKGPFPDPASRFQPEGVHGPSEVVDPASFAWSDSGWRGRSMQDLVIYELHVGTFSPAGTFQGVIEKLPYLAQLGVTAIELMPVADFPGQHNWGYDGVDLFAPARCYGRPDDLRQLVDEAHRLGLAVLLDVVYNHLGPDGNYTGVYSPYYSGDGTDWGSGLNFDGKHSGPVRQFFLQNALHWLHEYHLDGLRLDATHVIQDRGPKHFLQELAETVRAAITDRQVLLIAEDHRNLNTMIQPITEGGWGLDGIWADDFHHQVRRHLAGDHEGYYRDYTGSLADLATTIRQGWFYCGQPSLHLGGPRGSDPSGVDPRQIVVCIQNHDQIGNRALGERLHHQIDLAAYRAASALLFVMPMTPLLFMGQEWAATSPFQFFTDHNAELGKLVTEGRRKEFRHFQAFTDPKARERIPDPQALATFEATRLKWDEVAREPHASLHRLYERLIRLRRSEPALQESGRRSLAVAVLGEAGMLVRRRSDNGSSLFAIVLFQPTPSVDLRQHPLTALCHSWERVLTTEDPEFSPSGPQPRIDLAGPTISTQCPVAVFLKARS